MQKFVVTWLMQNGNTVRLLVNLGELQIRSVSEWLAHNDEIGSISVDRQRERSDLVAKQKRELESLRAVHSQARTGDADTHRVLLADLQRVLDQRNQDDHERMEATHRDAERRLKKQLEESKGGFVAERAET